MAKTNFKLGEFLRSATAKRKKIDNTPDEAALRNLTKLMALAERIRVILGNRPVKITSGYRSPALNKAVGGVRTSDHMFGLAMDFRGVGTSIETAFLKLCEELPADSYRVIIQEKHRWIHISLPDGKRPNGIQLRYHGNGRYTRA